MSFDTGLGKTHTAILHAHRNPSLRPVIIVCPGYLKWQWQSEVTTVLGEHSEVIEGLNPRRSYFSLQQPILIINYEILHKWVKTLRRLKPKIIILDECQRVCNRTARCTQATQALVKKVPHLLALSATPFTKKPAQLWTILNMLCPEKFPNFFPYAWKFCKPEKKFGKWRFDGAENLDILHKRLLKWCMIRVRKQDVFKDLPPKIRLVVPLELKSRTEYNQELSALKKMVGLGKKERNQAFSQIEKIKQVIAQEKLPQVYEWIDNFLETTEEKLLIFGVHQKVVKQIHDRYKDSSVLVFGDINPKRRQLAVHKFQKSKKCRLFVGNIQAGGVGLNLTAASQVAFVELPWNPSDVSQAEDRCFGRVSDLHGATVHFILGKGTIEEWLCKTIQKKQRILDAVLDNGKVELSFDVFNEFLEMLKSDRQNLRRGVKHEHAGSI